MAEGHFTLVVGPMYSGKTSELISFVEIYSLGRKPMKVFKPVLDDRYDKASIVSHANAKVEAIAVSASREILAHITGEEKAVFVDEVQFFDPGLSEVLLDLTSRGINVFCSGLDLNFRNQPFETTMILMAHADTIVKKKAVCHRCGEYEGTISHKTVRDDREIDVGGFEKYIAACRACYRTLNQDPSGEQLPE
ncbi:MAG: thymidine kinase [Candidatus Ozemobacteraceae bacterium]